MSQQHSFSYSVFDKNGSSYNKEEQKETNVMDYTHNLGNGSIIIQDENGVDLLNSLKYKLPSSSFTPETRILTTFSPSTTRKPEPTQYISQAPIFDFSMEPEEEEQPQEEEPEEAPIFDFSIEPEEEEVLEEAPIFDFSVEPEEEEQAQEEVPIFDFSPEPEEEEIPEEEVPVFEFSPEPEEEMEEEEIPIFDFSPEPIEKEMSMFELSPEPEESEEETEAQEEEEETEEYYSNYQKDINFLSENFLMENFVSFFYFGSLTVIGLYIIYKMIQKTK
jgi:hypothetical protein